MIFTVCVRRRVMKIADEEGFFEVEADGPEEAKKEALRLAGEPGTALERVVEEKVVSVEGAWVNGSVGEA